MNQADIAKLVSRLRFQVHPKKRLPNIRGPLGRLERLRDYVTALIKYERIECYYPKADESRGYAERLISDAIRYGDQHAPTMEMANFWITEKQYIHKLFKVIVPRLQNCPLSYTRMYKAPKTYPDITYWDRAVLELRGNPYPDLKPTLSVNRNFIHNVLLDEAKKEYQRKKYAHLNQETVENTANTESVDEITEKLEQTTIESKDENASQPDLEKK
ncbi:39S ribosomal protein L17, mitochondrial [Contarinia nasturtii]|uniref:39S ribosomal protein L17, mitochondrial n=1 Tax=Contarinia nasturtii TaxID=265458 RepID=UPI0012D390B5|nr:39S ribosomal protein L17, mitochondrial [Contarinia nasturtii]